jgi:hypothetical protein
MNKRDYKIFPPKQRTSNSINTTAETNYLSHNKYTNNMKCERLHCKCPNEHVRKENVKLCNHCVSDVQPTIWKNNKLPYEKSDLHSKTGY